VHWLSDHQTGQKIGRATAVAVDEVMHLDGLNKHSSKHVDRLPLDSLQLLSHAMLSSRGEAMLSTGLFAIFVLMLADTAAHRTSARFYIGRCDSSDAALLTHNLIVGDNHKDNRLRFSRFS
jgi:hypothetical protein